jgi:hypothetical protein
MIFQCVALNYSYYVDEVDHLPVPPSDPNMTLVPASCSLVKRDESGMVVEAVFLVW